ncbi:DUF3703 domain-containing protein [Altererythrobacter sp. Z27]|uniref:DUF3703 domain-containing protein n=1 Tax=Altererythrobacter sp. Z27 TaxID=3461147 RepID=UPI004043F4EA
MDRKRLKALFEHAMDRARQAEDGGDYLLAFAELEQAHILGQRWLLRHLRSHWAMLRIARLTGDEREACGQITRLIGSPLFWLVGWLPKGNSGGANVNPLKPMPYPPKLAAELSGYHVWRDVALRLAVLIAIVFAVRLLG